MGSFYSPFFAFNSLKKKKNLFHDLGWEWFTKQIFTLQLEPLIVHMNKKLLYLSHKITSSNILLYNHILYHEVHKIFRNTNLHDV